MPTIVIALLTNFCSQTMAGSPKSPTGGNAVEGSIARGKVEGGARKGVLDIMVSLGEGSLVWLRRTLGQPQGFDESLHGLVMPMFNDACMLCRLPVCKGSHYRSAFLSRWFKVPWDSNCAWI